MKTSTWQSEVKPEDIDFQGIVYNGVYLEYFDYARRNYLLTKNTDLETLHHQGFDIVVVHVDLTFKKSLKMNDKFMVKSQFHESGRLRLVFDQEIYKLGEDKLVAKAITTIACVSVKTGKPVPPGKILGIG